MSTTPNGDAANGNVDRIDNVSEHTPLIPKPVGASTSSPDAAEASPEDPANGHAKGPRTYNKTQVILLSCCRMVDPIAFFCIVPFVNQMIYDSGEVKEEDVGFYSGLIESLFSLVQMFTMVPWGRISDRYGRKPVLVISLTGLVFTASSFGFSQSVWQMIMLRCMGGLFSGAVVAIRASVTENSTKETQASAFSIFAFFGHIGLFVGTLLGGALVKPAEQYPSIFGKIQFFHDFPYALPTMTVGVLIIIALAVSVFFINETLDRESSTTGSSGGSVLSTWEVLKSPGVPIVLFVAGLTNLLGFAFTAVAPAFWFTSVDLGGFSFDPQKISMFIALAGISQAFWIIFVFPMLHKGIGTIGIMKLCAIVWPLCFLLNPAANSLLKHQEYAVFWALAPVVVIVFSGCCMAFTGAQLAINDISPTPSSLGTINGMALSIGSGVRAFTPALFLSIFAFGVGKQILHGQLIWLVMFTVGLVYGISLYWFPEKASGRRKVDHSEGGQS